jgi:serralysin
MATLTVTATHDYTGETLDPDDPIDQILFATSAISTATFARNQFGTGDNLISNSVQLTGDEFANNIQVNLAAAGTFSAAGWAFSNWTDGTDIITGTTGTDTITINGTSGDDTLTGSSRNDIIFGGLGGDNLNGGDGDDVFRYTATGDVPGSENVDGGNGFDTIEISAGSPAFGPAFAINATLTSIEALRFTGAGTTQATLNSNQIGAGAIAAVTGSAGANVLVVNSGAFEDLSGVTFTDWTDATSLIAINGGPGADNLTGSSRNDVIKGGGGSDVLNGGDGDDAFTYEGGSDVGAAETVNGGNGTDLLETEGTNDFSAGATLISIEALQFAGAGTTTLKGTQIGAGQITAITGSVGTNVIVVNAASDVDLSALTFTSWTAGTDTITIDGTADGETLTGSSQVDTIKADGGDDVLTGGAGNDGLNGGLGHDTAVFSGNRSSYTLQVVDDAIVMSGLDGTDKLRSIERLQFADGTIELVNDGSALFDTLFYLDHNPDVFAAGVDPLGHFNTFGFHEGRDPNAWFDTSGYLAINKDVAAAGVNPLDHYHQFGWKEGRDPSPDFDTTLYLINNPDVAAAGVDPLEHFLQFGISEHRSAFAAVGQKIFGGFDAEFYLWHNPDVAAAGVDPVFHFNVIGWQEGRDPNAWFDTAGYLSHYTDVAAAGINPLSHYEAVGWTEGRDPSAGFDTLGYLAANPDVAAAGINPLDHFLRFGIYEGRQAVNDGVFH